ncbi:MAG: carboxypeptidase regulatory-like domain-containing protein [Pyrinomonadaceae bacterium]
MYKNRASQCLLMLFVIISFTGVFTFAQDGEVVTETISVATSTLSRDSEEDDTKITGATVRGRVFYEDTGRPVRYALVTLVGDKSDSYSNYSLKFVKTDENGEFVIKNVKAGTYLPYIKSEGILNKDSYNFSFRSMPKEKTPLDLYEKLTVSGLAEFQINIAAKRGGAIGGRITYADGEAAVGVKVEVLKKAGEIFSNSSLGYSGESGIGTVKTDDRGVYRISGLPEGIYVVRVIEPISHKMDKADYAYNYRDNQGSLLKTYFPTGDDSTKAKEIELLAGQEESSIDITIPERQLFGITGKIVQKANGQPIEKMIVNFFKIVETEQKVADYSSQGNSVSSNKLGEWGLKGLPKGKYRITVTQGGYSYTSESQREAQEKQKQFPTVSKDIEITDKNISDLTFEMPSEASIDGTVVVEGGKIMPPDVRLFAVNAETGETSFSDYNYSTKKQEETPQQAKEKTFRIGRMKEGKYMLVFSDRSYYVKSVSGGGTDSSGQAIEVKEGEEIKGVQITLASDFGTVKGKIDNFEAKDEAFVIMVKSDLSIEQSAQGTFSGVVKPTGDYEVKASPGEYSIFIFTPAMRPKPGTNPKEFMQNTIKNAQKVTVKANETTSFNLKMP